MRRRKLARALRFVAWLLVAGLAPGPAPAGAEELDPGLVDEIETSVDVGLKTLCFRQRPDGSYGGSSVATALVVQALMDSHRRYVEEDGPCVRRALGYLAAAAGPDGVIGEPPALEATALASRVLRRSTHPEWRAAGERGEAFLRNAAGGEAPGAPLPLAPQEQVSALEALGRGEAPASRVLFLLVHALDASGRGTCTDGAGERPWRSVLARALIDSQEFEGTWPDDGAEPSDAGRVEATAYALLALERLLGE